MPPLIRRTSAILVNRVMIAPARPSDGTPLALYPRANRAHMAARMQQAWDRGAALGKLTGAFVAADYLPPEPIQPSGLTPTTVSTIVALQNAVAAGNNDITVDTDLSGTIILNGSNCRIKPSSPGRKLDGVINIGNSTGADRLKFVGLGIQAIQAVFPANPVSDLTIVGCTFNITGGTGTTSLLLNGVERMAVVECVGRAGNDVAVSGPFCTLTDCTGYIAGCNLSGAEGSTADDWVARINDNSVIWIVNTWGQSRVRSVTRHGGDGARVFYYTTPDAIGTDRETRLINVNQPLITTDQSLLGDGSQSIGCCDVRWYADDFAGGSFTWGGVGVTGAPYSRRWWADGCIIYADSGVATDATLAARESANEDGEEDWFYVSSTPGHGTVMDNSATATRPTPPTISSAELLALGFPGGEPRWGTTQTSDPYDLDN